MTRVRVERRDALAAAILSLTALWLGATARHVAYDDAWITYRYAHNLASGHGLVYNAGERWLGTTAPGYAVLLGAIASVRPDAIPAISGWLCVLALVVIGLGLYAFGWLRGSRIAGFAAGLFFVVNPIAVEAFGGEMLPQAAFAVAAFVAQAGGRPLVAIGLACAAAILRPDGLLVVGLIGLWQIWQARGLPWRSIALATVVLGLWFGALWWYYGWPLPQTLGVKHAQRVSGYWRPLGMDLVEWFRAFTPYGSRFFPGRPAPGFTAWLWLAAAGLVAALWHRGWWPLIAWPVLYLVAYRQLHLPFYHWYAVPPVLGLASLAGGAVDAIAALVEHALSRIPGRTSTGRIASAAPAIVCAAACLVIAMPLARYTAGLAGSGPNPAERAYRELGLWLAAHTSEDTRVGYLEIGILGYYSRRAIVDPIGLVNPGVASHVRAGDFLWAYRTHRPDLILHNPAFLPERLGIVLDEPWFRAEYIPVRSFESGRPEPITVYARRGTRTW